MNKKILLLFVVLFGVFSCKDTDVMPRVAPNNAHGNNESAYAKPPKYEYNGPTTQLGVNAVVSTSDVVVSRSRTMILDQKDVQHRTGTQKNVAVRWVKGDKYKLMTCVRYVKANSADWRPQYGTAIGTIIEDPQNSNNLLMKLDGRMDIANDQLQNSTHGSIAFNEPDNWYFGAIILEKIEGENTGSFGEVIKDNDKPTKLKVSSRDKLIAVGNDDANFSMDNVPLGIPFHKVRIDEKDNVVPNGGTFKVRPIGNIVNLKLTNDFAFPVLVSREMKVKLNSKMIFKQGMALDFWQYENRTADIINGNFVFHYDNSDSWQAFDGGILKSQYSELSVDWSQARNTTKVTQNGKEYTKLRSGETVNLYIWTMMNVNYDGTPAQIEVDYRDVDLQVPVYSYVGDNPTTVIYKPAMNHAGGTRLGDLTVYGYGAETLDSKIQQDGTPLSLSYLKFKSKNPISFGDGRTYTIPMSLHSDLIISEVYFNWGDFDNTGVFEFYNPNRNNVELKDYYLARIRYKTNPNNDLTGHDQKDRGSIHFRSVWLNDDKRFQYALLMPLDFNNKYEITAAGGDIGKPLFNDFWNGSYADPVKEIWSGNYDGSDDDDKYIARPRLAFPNSDPVDYKPTSITGGTIYAYGGYGVYVQGEESKRKDFRYVSTDASQGILSNRELGYTLFSYANWRPNGKPNRLGMLWGVWDGRKYEDGKKENVNASTNDKAAGILNRDSDQGWALVKKIGGKFYIIDTFGPARNEGIDQSTMINQQQFLTMYQKRPKDFRYWSMRNQQVVFPQGPYMYRDQWNVANDMNSEYANIGARARYMQTGRPDVLPE